MIVLKVKDAQSDDDSLEMPEWMNNALDIESDGSESSTDFNGELSSDSSSDASSDSSCNLSLEDEGKELGESCNDEEQEDFDNSSDNAASSLSDDMDEELDGLELFPAYHLTDNMDTSDDEATAMARGCWFWHLYDKGHVSFPTHNNRDADSEGTTGETESTSSTDEKSKILEDTKIFNPSTPDKSDTAPNESTPEKSTHSMAAKSLDA